MPARRAPCCAWHGYNDQDFRDYNDTAWNYDPVRGRYVCYCEEDECFYFTDETYTSSTVGSLDSATHVAMWERSLPYPWVESTAPTSPTPVASRVQSQQQQPQQQQPQQQQHQQPLSGGVQLGSEQMQALVIEALKALGLSQQSTGNPSSSANGTEQYQAAGNYTKPHDVVKEKNGKFGEAEKENTQVPPNLGINPLPKQAHSDHHQKLTSPAAQRERLTETVSEERSPTADPVDPPVHKPMPGVDKSEGERLPRSQSQEALQRALDAVEHLLRDADLDDVFSREQITTTYLNMDRNTSKTLDSLRKRACRYLPALPQPPAPLTMAQQVAQASASTPAPVPSAPQASKGQASKGQARGGGGQAHGGGGQARSGGGQARGGQVDLRRLGVPMDVGSRGAAAAANTNLPQGRRFVTPENFFKYRRNQGPKEDVDIPMKDRPLFPNSKQEKIALQVASPPLYIEDSRILKEGKGDEGGKPYVRGDYPTHPEYGTRSGLTRIVNDVTLPFLDTASMDLWSGWEPSLGEAVRDLPEEAALGAAFTWMQDRGHSQLCARCRAMKLACNHQIDCQFCKVVGARCLYQSCDLGPRCNRPQCEKYHPDFERSITDQFERLGYLGNESANEFMNPHRWFMNPFLIPRVDGLPRLSWQTDVTLPPPGSGLPHSHKNGNGFDIKIYPDGPPWLLIFCKDNRFRDYLIDQKRQRDADRVQEEKAKQQKELADVEARLKKLKDADIDAKIRELRANGNEQASDEEKEEEEGGDEAPEGAR